MIRKDIVMRWTQELAKVLSRLMGKDPKTAVSIMRESYIALLDLSPEELFDLTEDEVVRVLKEERDLNEGQLDFLAELLYREGKMYLELEQKELAQRHLKIALLIFEDLEREQEVYSAQRNLQLIELRMLLKKK